MQVIHDGDSIPDSCAGTAVSMGVYDGVHLGHRALLAQLRDRAERDGLATAVVTFDKHPALITRPENAPKLLTTLEQKLELLDDAGIEFVYLIEFTEERARTSAVEFFRDEMDGTAMPFFPCIEYALMRVEPGIRGQERRVNVQYLARIALDECGAENAHEAGQHQ